MPARSRALLVALALLALGAAIWGIERAIVTEPEAVRAAFAELVRAVGEEERGPIEAGLFDPFEYQGPAPIRGGDREEVFVGLEEYWRLVDDTKFSYPTPEVKLAGGTASLTASGLLRFDFGGGLVAHRMTMVVTFGKVDGRWIARSTDIVELQRGLF